ncbi:MAG: winged helix DNA-binding domain-containing protein [Acidimicrobiia bacterium]|nr:winged helix DNA-binding domain-containing protein [Acidimicrobiia bacterium]
MPAIASSASTRRPSSPHTPRSPACSPAAPSGRGARSSPRCARGLSSANEQVGHLLLLAELRALICSGPRRDGRVHTYALLDDVVAPAPAGDRDDAVRELVGSFFGGHGPVAVTDLLRWTRLT